MVGQIDNCNFIANCAFLSDIDSCAFFSDGFDMNFGVGCLRLKEGLDISEVLDAKMIEKAAEEGKTAANNHSILIGWPKT